MEFSHPDDHHASCALFIMFTAYRDPTCFPSISLSNLSKIGLQSSSRMVELEPSTELRVRVVESPRPSMRLVRLR